MDTKLLYLFMIFTTSILIGESLNCYQCRSSTDPDCKENFDHVHKDELMIKPTECKVDAAAYCIKTTGVWGGIVGTTRFCSSRGMGNQCQYVTYPDHDRTYRACIYTCSGEGCNSAPLTSASTFSALLTVLISLFIIKYVF